MSQTLEQRIHVIEDVLAIQKLTATYGKSVDFGLDGGKPDVEELRTIFAEDATWFYTATGVTTRGRDEIVAMLAAAPDQLEFAMHSFSNPIIEVDGDTATGTYLLWVGINDNEVYQRENLTYKRTPEGWVIQSIDLRFGRMLNS